MIQVGREFGVSWEQGMVDSGQPHGQFVFIYTLGYVCIHYGGIDAQKDLHCPIY